jgi:hypothetical protein
MASRKREPGVVSHEGMRSGLKIVSRAHWRRETLGRAVASICSVAKTCGVGSRVGWRRRVREFKAIGSSDQVHVVDALAITGDEGRGSLRKAPGSWQTSIDPEMSEWGNPPARVSLPEYIGERKLTC